MPLLPVHARTRRTAPVGPRAHGLARAAALLLLAAPACYAGDFFDRLVDPDATAAFRITQLTLVDPHTYSGDMLLCQDSTATFNQLFSEHIASFDINTTLVLHPLDPAKDNETTLDIVPAKCVPGGDGALVNCTDKDVPPTTIITADFNNSEGGTCGNPVAGTLNPAYQTGDGALNKPTSPCFLSALIPALSLQLAPTLGLPLSNVQIYAAYDLDEPQKLVQGVLFGFLPSTVAMGSIGVLNGAPFVPWSVLAGGDACKITVDDIDTVALPKDGVWMYFNFTAERVAWSSPSVPTPGDDSTSTTL